MALKALKEIDSIEEGGVTYVRIGKWHGYFLEKDGERKSQSIYDANDNASESCLDILRNKVKEIKHA